MSSTPILKNGFLDLAAILFVIGGVVSLIISVLTLPIFSIFPFIIVPFFFVFAVVFVVGLVCSLVAILCYNLVTQRLLSKAGMRGITAEQSCWP